MPDSPKSHKAKLKAAQAAHLADLFGDQAAADSKPTAQQAQAQQQARAHELAQAAQAKRAQLDPAEAAKLAELQQRSQAARRQAPPAPTQPKPPTQPTSQAKPPATQPPAQPKPTRSELHDLSRRNDLAASALENMRRNLDQGQAPTPRDQAVAPSAPPAAPRPSEAPAPARPTRKAPPSPEELDKLLREMAQRASGRPRPRPAMGMPGMPERPEAAPVVETPPPPPEVFEQEKANEEKSAEILKELQAKEHAAQQNVAPIPQVDQERAVEAPVEAEVSLKTRGNSISSGELYQSINHLRAAMRVHDAGGQVEGVNQVQQQMPGHPLNEDQQPGGAT